MEGTYGRMETDPIKQIAIFRVPELQLCLQQLQLSKTGLKSILQARLSNHLRSVIACAEQAAPTDRLQQKKSFAVAVVHRIYCRLKGIADGCSPASVETISTPGYLANGTGFVAEGSQPDSAPAGGSAKDSSQIRCICGQSHDKGTMIQCKDCGVWQHCECVRVDVRASRDARHACELCRLAKADPFWRRLGAPLAPPMKLTPVQPPRIGFNGCPIEEDVSQVVDRHFQVAHSQLDPVRRHGGTNQLQVACLMLADPVALRVHWPRNADLRMNNMMYKPYARGPNAKLGVNSRDDMASVGIMVTPGRNRLYLHALDKEHYCIVIYLAQQRTDSEVRAMMHPPETTEEALSRVQQKAQGRGVLTEDDNDDDLEVCATEFSLRCPLSGSRIRTPARFAGVGGLTAFDLDTFLGMVKRSKKWQCPHSMRNLPVQDLMIDGYLSRILPRLQALPNVMDIEANPETGEWRIAGSQGAWMHIREDPAELLDASVAIKPEPQLSAAAAAAAPQGGSSDSDEELSEGEELRQAAAAAAAHSKRGSAAKEDEVIVLSDSDDDGPAPPLPPPPPPQQHRSAPALHAPHRPGGSQPAKRLAQQSPPRLAYPSVQRPMPASVQPGSSAAAGRVSPHLQSPQEQSVVRTPATALSWQGAGWTPESFQAVSSPQVIQGRGITIRLPGSRLAEASPAAGNPAQGHPQTGHASQRGRPLPHSLAAPPASARSWPPLQHPAALAMAGAASQPVQPWTGGHHAASSSAAAAPLPYASERLPPLPTSPQPSMSPRPPAYTNAKPLPHPLRFGTTPAAELSQASSYAPQSPEAAALDREPMPFREGSRALEQRFGIHKRPAPSSLGQPPPKRPHQLLPAQAPPLPQAPGMPPVPSPAPFSAGTEQQPGGASSNSCSNAEYNEWLNMLLTGGPEAEEPQAGPQHPPQAPAAHTQHASRRQHQHLTDIVDLDTSAESG